MLDSLRLYLHYVRVSVRSQMQYRASFIMLTIGQFLITGGEFLAIAVLFDRFGNLRGWSLAEIGVFYGLISVAFALSEAGVRGFDLFAGMIRSGEFDRVLLRPRTTVLQIVGREVQIMRVGRIAQALVVLLWAATALQVQWTAGRVLLMAWAVVGGAFLFSGLFVLQATLCFWTVETLELANTLTYGGVETGQYPLTIYREWFRKFFTYIVPLAAVSYFPALAILERQDPLGTTRLFQVLAPAIGFAFFGASLLVWQVGVRHYHSTGS
jgi:ABC-2 type transport system permease protein